MSNSKIKQADSRVNFPQLEDTMTQFWKEKDIFKKSVEQRPVEDSYRFLDGPPFPSGMPHYGHLCWSVGKDIIPRYQTMQGKRVRRVWGWDCHGIAVESKVNKELGISSRKDIEEYGVENYVKKCREYVERQIANWGWYIEKIGRWVDLENAYYTMYPEYHESVMWGFKQIWDKGYVYKGKRVSLYSVETCTPVSDFEVAEGNDYRDIEDLSVFVKFELDSEFVKQTLKTEEKVDILAWTTTPWTLPANFALAVNPEAQYVLVRFEGALYVAAKDRLQAVFQTTQENVSEEKDALVQILNTFSGSELDGAKYTPLYNYFVEKSNENDFKVYLYDGVTTEDGTGVLHVAPAFGEEDFNLGQKFSLSDFSDIDEEGKLTVEPWSGTYLRDTMELIAEDLAKKNLLFRSEMYTHRLPFYRGSEPLIYMAQDQYFIDVQSIKSRMLELNEDINWTPADVKTGRFPAIIQSAPDWAVSRNRYWATVMPIWESEDGDQLVMGTFEEMSQFTDQIEARDEGGRKVYYVKESGEKLSAHRDKMDSIVLTKDGKSYKRIEEVLDVWLDSGCASFAEFHYPIENKDIFLGEEFMPADFIIEGAGMVRAWFNVLHRVSTLIFDKAAFLNVICGGTFSGNDGRKMSKTYGNYSDPKDVLENLGGETLRLYLAGSAVMGGGETDWSDEVLKEMQKNVLLPFWNTYRYLTLYTNMHNWTPTTTAFTSKNVLDTWIENFLMKTTKDYAAALDQYNIPASTKLIQPAIDNLSTWWIRRSRDRFANGSEDALQTLYASLVLMCKTFAPQMPFLCEAIYQNLVVEAGVEGAKESVHLEDFPKFGEVDEELLKEMEVVRVAASVGLKLREDAKMKLRQPLQQAWSAVQNEALQQVLQEELNVKEIHYSADVVEGDGYVSSGLEDVKVTLDTNLTEELENEGLFNDLSRHIQEMRKKGGFKVGEKINVQFESSDDQILKVIETYEAQLKERIDALKFEKGEVTDGAEAKLGAYIIKLKIGK